jgi:ribosomal protein S18 acetylase RimI-like enzyme
VIGSLAAPLASSVSLSDHQAVELERLNRLLAAGDGELRVARLGGVGVGHALIVYRLTSFVEEHVLADHDDPRVVVDELNARRSGLLTDVLVVPGHRRRGVGGALVEDAIARARAAKLRELTLFVAADNIEARRLYARLGFHHARSWPHVLEYSYAL